MTSSNNEKQTLPPQQQNKQPGIESEMNPLPVWEDKNYKSSDKLKGKVAIITGGDSGIGRAVSVLFAKEGATVVIVYLNEHDDAQKTKEAVEKQGQQCLLLAGDVGQEEFCQHIVDETIKQYSRIDILINNAAEQHPQNSIEDITSAQLERTFRTNIFSFFYLTKAALPYMTAGSTIINTASVTAYEGNETLLDYSSTKGAVVTFTRSLAKQLVTKGIRVNGVAPGPIWTPLIPSTFNSEKVKSFGANTPMGRPGQPVELAPSYLLLASDDSSYMTGQMLHVNGGTAVSG
ncbi:SDR family oxidoreductase [Sutcliffiella cohnii]|uniref:NAD(P)-dependent oxidoreductase n=1 Tax=Sutcliffiella cohnii TaxID=33932 RepID=A0A223KMF5_9BACI|nr:SDR family oxidoreductase [Sutcliffiella cohnii]AST90567.1 NAD(P)-dependent oxidoreductase [Sutcliffiella cohnii]MED4016851.1 SDR family oxidoreductase [Sutcliffiella cohnii]